MRFDKQKPPCGSDLAGVEPNPAATTFQARQKRNTVPKRALKQISMRVVAKP